MPYYCFDEIVIRQDFIATIWNSDTVSFWGDFSTKCLKSNTAIVRQSVFSTWLENHATSIMYNRLLTVVPSRVKFDIFNVIHAVLLIYLTSTCYRGEMILFHLFQWYYDIRERRLIKDVTNIRFWDSNAPTRRKHVHLRADSFVLFQSLYMITRTASEHDAKEHNFDVLPKILEHKQKHIVGTDASTTFRLR